jgi:hypothetical protein
MNLVLSETKQDKILFYQKVTLDLKLEGFNWSTGDEGPYSAWQKRLD